MHPSDAAFWRDMNRTPSPEPRPPPVTALEFLLATPAGKPLLHYSQPTSRPRQSLSALCAAVTAFQATSHNRVRTITTPHHTLLTYADPPFHAVLLTPSRNTPHSLLRALLRAALSVLYASLSAAFRPHLTARPHIDPSATTPLTPPLLVAALRHASAHPLPHLCLSPPALAAPQLPNILHQLHRSHLNIRHVLLVTALPPHPQRLIAHSTQSSAPLTSLDLLLLLAVPDPPLLYLQSDSFSLRMRVTTRRIALRLHPDHVHSFHEAVGGSNWRPQWHGQAAHVVSLLAVHAPSENPTAFLDAAEHRLDRSAAAFYIAVSLETSLSLSHIPPTSHPARSSLCAIIVIANSRIIATNSSFDPRFAVPIHRALSKPYTDSDWRTMEAKSDRLLIVIYRSRYLLCFELNVPLSAAVHFSKHTLLPWLMLPKNQSRFVSSRHRVLIHPRTPLSGFLSPFDS